MSELNPELVKRYWRHMEIRFGARTVPKSTSGRMEAAAWFLDKMGILNKTAFMNRFTTTIDRTIYIPFEVGSEDSGYDLWDQISTMAHECQHVRQATREGFTKFSVKYLGSQAHRAWYEAEAYRCNVELHWWRHKALPDLAEVANRLQNYACTENDIAFVRAFLEASVLTICKGGLVSEGAQEAIGWLENEVPEMKGQ